MSKELLTLILLLAVSFGSCKNSSKKGDKSPGVQLDEHAIKTEWVWNGGEVAGTVSNLTDARISYVELQMQLVDEHSMPKLNFRVINNNGIDPRGTWDFRQGASMVGARRVQLIRSIVK